MGIWCDEAPKSRGILVKKCSKCQITQWQDLSRCSKVPLTPWEAWTQHTQTRTSRHSSRTQCLSTTPREPCNRAYLWNLKISGSDQSTFKQIYKKIGRISSASSVLSVLGSKQFFNPRLMALKAFIMSRVDYEKGVPRHLFSEPTFATQLNDCWRLINWIFCGAFSFPTCLIYLYCKAVNMPPDSPYWPFYLTGADLS